MNSAQPSAEYLAAVAEGARHHADSKTYSGSFLRPHKHYLHAMIDALGCKSALDVGAGKGVQYDWIDPADGKTLEQAWNLEVTKYDPCWPPYAAEPVGTFDLVICTHTISLIPKQDLEWWTDRLFGYANKMVFIAEKIGQRRKGEIADPHNRAISWTAADWISFLDHSLGALEARMMGPSVLVFSAREELERGKITTRHLWENGMYAGSFEAEPRA